MGSTEAEAVPDIVAPIKCEPDKFWPPLAANQCIPVHTSSICEVAKVIVLSSVTCTLFRFVAASKVLTAASVETGLPGMPSFPGTVFVFDALELK